MIQLRYEKKGEAYVPQYRYKNKEEFQDFKESYILKMSMIQQVAEELGKISWGIHYKNRWSQEIIPMWYVMDDKRWDFNSLHYRSEMHVCAFLGAAKIWWQTQIKEFEL